MIVFPRDWLQKGLPEDQYELTVSMPDDLLAELYPNILRYGPNGDAVRQFGADALKVLWETEYDELERKLAVSMFQLKEPQIYLPSRIVIQLDLLSKHFENEATFKIEDGLNTLLTLIAYYGFASKAYSERVVTGNYYRHLIEAYGLNPSDYAWA